MIAGNDSDLQTIAQRVITNAQWASIYLAYFESSNKFLRANQGRLDGDAHEMLKVLDTGLPRLGALCLCRLWDMPGKDRHSLPALIKTAAFSSLTKVSDPSFIKDCRIFLHGSLATELRQFRITDLAHNLPFGRDANEALTIDRLRELLRLTQIFVDRLVHILKLSDASQDAIFQSKELNCEKFWEAVAPNVIDSESYN